MNPILKILLFVSFVLKESTSTTSNDSTPQYDITKQLNEAIIKIFQSANPTSTMRLISHMENRACSKYETRNSQRLPSFGNKIYFHNINISIWEPLITPKLYCEFHKNKTRIFNEELVFKVVGLVDTQPKKPYASFKTHMKFKDISISAVESSKGIYNNQFQINFSYNRMMYNYLTLPWTRDDLPHNKQEKLIKRIKTIIPTMVHDNINHNENFLHVLHSSFCHNPKQRIISSYPNFSFNEEQYYYLIPKVSFLGVNLVNVKIVGLSNFESLRPNITFGNSAYTLLVKKIQGSMNLDNKEFEELSFYEMKFKIDHLFITVDYETKRLVVEARDYSVLQTNAKTARESIFSTVIMQNIETAITLSIMQSLEVSNEIHQAPITQAPETSTPQKLTESSTDSDPIHSKKNSDITDLKNATLKSGYARFSRAMYEYAFKKSFESSSKSPTTKIATTLGKKTTRSRSRTTHSSTPSQTTTELPQTSTESVFRSKTSSSSTVTSPKTDSTTTTPSYETSQSSSTYSREILTREVITETSRTSELRDRKSTTNSTPIAEDDPFDYDISFHNVTIKLISGFNYPKQIQCEFFKNLKIDHQINAIPTGNIRLNNKGSSININFHANFTAIQISVVKPGNNSKENASCEFHIHNNQDIKVILPSKKNKAGVNGDLKIKNKIDQTLLSVMKDRITRTVKPVVCLPFSFCSQSVKVLDDFFQSFVDNVLKKCSLRRTTK